MESNVILVFGMRGTGKSFFVKQKLLPVYPRQLIYDNQGEYKDGIIFYDLAKLKKFWAENYDKKFRMIFRPLNHDDFSEICRLVYLCGNMLFVIEELDLVAGSYDNDIDFQTVLKRGRHTNITLLGISQRPYGINRTITSQAKEIYSFCQKEPRDVQYLKNYLGNDSEIIQSLPQYHALYYNYNVQGFKIITLKGNEIVEIKNISTPQDIEPEEPEEPREEKP